MNVDTIPEPFGWEDSITGLGGPDLWQRLLVIEVARSIRYARALTVVVIQVEGVIELGDTWGDRIAGRSLHDLAQCLLRLTRTSDTCARIGPTRFGVILTETNEIEAINFVERAREEAPLALPKAARGVRLAFGWANPEAGESADAVVRRAGQRLTQELLHR